MHSNKNNIFLITIFIAAISLPLIFSDKEGGRISAIENRYLATFPKNLTADMMLSHGVRVELENWINDNVGGRELALLATDTISYKLFHVLPWKDVIEGKDDWLYLLPDYDIPNYVNTNIPSKDVLAKIGDNYTRIAKDLKKLGIEFTVMIWPHKYSIYPEYMPNSLRKVDNTSAIDVLDRELKNNKNFDFETALEELRAGKQKRPVYYKAFDSSHWNQYGAFLAYTELINQVRKHLPNIKILSENDFSITPKNKITETAWGFRAEEEDLQYVLKEGYHAHSDLSFFDTFKFDSRDVFKSNNYYVNPDKSLPKAVIVGDSMIWQFMLPNLSESFSNLIFINYSDMANLNTIINISKPDIVIMAARGSGLAEIFATYQYSLTTFPYARIVSDNTPSQVDSGKLYSIEIIAENTGSETWNEEKKIRLCIFVDGRDFGYRISIPKGAEVLPGERFIFRLDGFHVEKNTYLEYQMVQEGYIYFGEKKRVDISVQ